MFYEELDEKRFLGPLQEKMDKILYKLSRKYKNPAVFPLYKDGEDLGIIMSCIVGRWDKDIRCMQYKVNSDFRDYYKNHDMLVLMNQTYGHKKNTIKIEVKNSFEFGLDKFMPVVYIEYQLQNNSEYFTKNFLAHVCIGPMWYYRENPL
jgi:hypothetical protein